MKIKLNVSMRGFHAEQEITIGDENGIPLDPFWRRRLKDAEIDNSVEIVQTKPKSETETKSKQTRKPRSSS